MVAGLLALWFYRGSGPETLYFCILSGGGGGSGPPVPPLPGSAHVLTTHARLVDDLTSARKGPFSMSCYSIVFTIE